MMGRVALDEEAKDVCEDRSGVDTEDGSSLWERDDSVSWLEEQSVDS
jgi:hypothetical protein